MEQPSWMFGLLWGSVTPTTQVQQRFLVVALGVLLNVVLQGLAELYLKSDLIFNMSMSLRGF